MSDLHPDLVALDRFSSTGLAQAATAADVAPETTTSTPAKPVFFSLVDQLRGLAALLVVYSHLVTNFLVERSMQWPVDDVVRRFALSPLRAELNFGWYGVAVFFFISGFVVTASAMTDSVRVFAVRRLLRVYLPVTATVVLVVLAASSGVDVYGIEVAPSAVQVLANITLANYVLVGQPILVSVGWTLAIEVVFYLLVAVLIPLLRARPAIAPAIILLVCFAFVQAAGAFPGSPELARLASSVAFVPLLVLGQVVYLAHHRSISPLLTAVLGTGAWLTYVIGMEETSPLFSGPARTFLVNAALALAVFVVVVLLEGRLRPSRLLTIAAKRSYSLYLLHVPVGYSLLRYLVVEAHVSYTVALPVAIIAVTLAVELVYRFVERPSVRLGRYLTRPRSAVGRVPAVQG